MAGTRPVRGHDLCSGLFISPASSGSHMFVIWIIELPPMTVSQPSAGVGNTGTFFIPSLSNGFSVFVGKPPCFL